MTEVSTKPIPAPSPDFTGKMLSPVRTDPWTGCPIRKVREYVDGYCVARYQIVVRHRHECCARTS